MESQSGQHLLDRAYQALVDQKYDQAAVLYEQAIEADATLKLAYWQLGLTLLLQGQEAEAQMTWLMAMADGELEQVEQWNRELAQILENEAARQAGLERFDLAWAVRQHLREVSPEEINNLLHLVALSLKLETFVPEDLVELGILEQLQEVATNVDETLLLYLLEVLLNQVQPHPLITEFVEAARPYAQPDAYIDVVLNGAISIAFFSRRPGVAALLAELCLELQPNNLAVLFELAAFYQNDRQYLEGIDTAKRAVALSENSADRVFASFLLVRGLMNAGGYWEEVISTLNQHEQILYDFLAAPPASIDLDRNARLITSIGFFPYVRDLPQQNRQMQERIQDFCRASIQAHYQTYFDKYQARHAERRQASALSQKLQSITSRKLKIGYVSHCFHEDSVGWLCRWLLQHHDRDQVELYLYFLTHREMPGDTLRPFFFQQADYARTLGGDRIEATEAIFADDLDILIDLDSVTLDLTCNILSLKPAPIQVTWLGWDAIGLSTVDYFLADPYVLPEKAQEYYTEKIWRLPQTYIAVDGFEVGIPNLRRDELGIPMDAVVYLSGQRGYKRHRDTARLQLQIIQQVPNSFFLIKGIANAEAVQQFFYELADEVGVERSRLLIIPEVMSEAVHRANLRIADVVLDTFPYNGATTTLETLWMGIPLVTRVGEQFAARNSYTMLKNAGVEEGIAWTDTEYVEWGVRFGTDSTLRRSVHQKLIQSRQSAPLWNGQQFARDMEKAYREMLEQWHQG